MTAESHRGDATRTPMADGDDGDSGGLGEKSLLGGSPAPSGGERCQLQTGKATGFLICNDICLATPGRPTEEMTAGSEGVTTPPPAMMSFRPTSMMIYWQQRWERTTFPAPQP